MTKKQLFNRWETRPYSWSQHGSWEWNKDEWFMKYVLFVKGESSNAMSFGNVVGASIGTNSPLSKVPRQSHMEFEVRAKIAKEGIELLGFFDSYCPLTKQLEEYKTSSNPKRWDQFAVDTHGQLTFYAMLLFLAFRTRPEDVKIRLHYIPVAEGSDFMMAVTGPHVSFETKRTTKQVFTLMVDIGRRRDEMKAFAKKKLDEMSAEELRMCK